VVQETKTGSEQRIFPDDWGLEFGKVVLYGGYCSACFARWFPRSKHCPSCLNDQVQRVALSGEGKLYCFSIVRVDASGMEAPYAIGYVDLQDGPRVFAHLSGWEDRQLRPDMAMQLTYGPLPLKDQDATVLTYKFAPLADAPVDGN